MTQFAPGNVQQSSPTGKRQRCCCCCSLRAGIIVLGILLLLKGAVLAYQWCYFSEEISNYSYYHYDDSSDDMDMTIDGSASGMNMDGGDHDSGDNDDHSGHYVNNDNDNDQDHDSDSDSEEQDGRKQGMGHDQDQDEQQSKDNGDQEEELDVDYVSDDSEEEEETYVIPTWMSVVAWVCVGWHILGGLFGTCAGCCRKKCCSFLFYVWWVISMTVAFACGVLYFYFYGVCPFLLGAFVFAMLLGIYFTVKAKKWYKSLKCNNCNGSQPRGYANLQSV